MAKSLSCFAVDLERTQVEHGTNHVCRVIEETHGLFVWRPGSPDVPRGRQRQAHYSEVEPLEPSL